jgi:hypothetical protein
MKIINIFMSDKKLQIVYVLKGPKSDFTNFVSILKTHLHGRNIKIRRILDQRRGSYKAHLLKYLLRKLSTNEPFLRSKSNPANGLLPERDTKV